MSRAPHTESSDRLPWGKFVWDHWENDPALSLCSLAAQGLWMRLLCLAVKEGGYVLIAGEKPTSAKLAKLSRCTAQEIDACLTELEEEHVFSRTSDGVIYSRRMVREAKLSRRNRENGAKGGNPKLRNNGENPASDNPPGTPPQQPPSPDPVKAEEIREEESREESSVPDGTGAEAPSEGPDDLAELRALDLKSGAWRLALKVLMDRGGYPSSRARPVVGKWAQTLTMPELWQAAESAWRSGTLDPVSYIAAAVERIRAEAVANPLLRPTEARQRLWMQDFTTSPRDWREHERGPKPGEPGCRVSPEIQREFSVEPAQPQAAEQAA